jgi:preprotein translocase subunit SecG
MPTLLLIVLVLSALGLVTLVLLQQGKGADAGAAFGSGASGTVFGSQGSGSFMTRATAVLAAIFFVSSLGLAYFSGQQRTTIKSVTELAVPAEEETKPVAEDVPVMPANEPVSSDVPKAGE